MSIDFSIFQFINQFAGRWPILDNLAIFFANYLGYILVLSIFIFFWKKWKIIAQSFLAGIISRFGITEIIRFFWERSRPFVENNVNLIISHDATGSFPSGHAAFYFAIATVVYFYNKKLGILFFIASFLMGVSRVFVGVHWPLDIVAGAVVGIFSGWIIVKLSKRFF